MNSTAETKKAEEKTDPNKALWNRYLKHRGRHISANVPIYNHAFAAALADLVKAETPTGALADLVKAETPTGANATLYSEASKAYTLLCQLAPFFKFPYGGVKDEQDYRDRVNALGAALGNVK